MLMNICYFVLDGLLLTSEEGTFKTPTFSDDNISRLFERFVLNYFKEHYPELKPSASFVAWNLDEGTDQFLPRMETDIVLSHGNLILIIDTKFYNQPMCRTNKLHSINLYQIYSYIKNKNTEHTGNVSGLFLYAQTEADIHPSSNYMIDRNRISAH